MQFIKRFICGLTGHNLVTQFDPPRVFMRCTDCHHETPGWTIKSRGPRQRYEGDSMRHRLRTATS